MNAASPAPLGQSRWRRWFSWHQVWSLPAQVALVVLILDQWTKRLIMTADELRFGSQMEIIPGFFSIVHVRNTGAAWGILANRTGFLALLSAVVLVVLVLCFRRFVGGWRERAWAISLIMGGIAGNLVDRVAYGSVVDFLNFTFGSYQFPAFNVADSAICVGVGLYVLSTFVRPEGDTPRPAAAT
jgi:signal peptidase II